MGVIDDIRGDIKRAGSSKQAIFYLRGGDKKRVRFLTDMEDATKITIHGSWTLKKTAPCGKTFGKKCGWCNDERFTTRDNYVWWVWNYDEKKVQALIQAVSRASTVPHLVQIYDQLGTLLGRDIVIARTGNDTSTTYSVIPMDKKRFKVADAKPFGNKKFLKLLSDAYDSTDEEVGDEEDDDDEDEYYDDDDEEEDDEDDEEEDDDDE